MGRHTASLNLDSEVFDALDALADQLGESRSEAANILLREGLASRSRRVYAQAVRDASVGAATLGLLYVLVHVAWWLA